MAPKISVVLATYQRSETLRVTLRHLQSQTLPAEAFEVIVVDDGSSDGTGAMVAAVQAEAAFDLRYLWHPNRGPGYTQNRGLDAARAALVLLLADDIFLAPQALEAHLDHHQRHDAPEVVVMGKILQSPALTGTVFLRTWDPFRFSELEHFDELPTCRFGAPNVSAKRDFLLRHGGFLEHRGRGGAAAFEDIELAYRLRGHGMRLRYERAALGWHHHVFTLDQAEARWFERGLNFGEFRRHAPHPELTVYYHVLNRETLAEYARVLRGPNPFHGRERSLAWHLFRHALRMLVLNRLTARWCWRPWFDLAEHSRWVAATVTPGMYRAYLYLHFLLGVDEGRRRWGPTGPPAVPIH